MTEPTKEQLKSDLFDFFLIQFDEKTAKQVNKHPDRAIPIIREYISTTHIPRTRLKLFQEAIENALAIHELTNK